MAESMEMLGEMKQCVPWSGEACKAAASELSAIPEFALLRSGERYQLLCDGDARGDGDRLQDVLERLGREVMVHVADHAADRIFVHAGVVAWQARALLLPGTSFSGKSTLVAALVRAGATYYSDEYAVLDACGRVHPYPRALQMREAGGIEQRSLSMGELKGKVGTVGVQASHIVFAEYESTGRWKPKPVSPGRAVLAMMEHTIAVQRTPARVMFTLAKVAESATAVRSERGDATLTASALLEMMSAERGS
jgi:hypothetical protein